MLSKQSPGGARSDEPTSSIVLAFSQPQPLTVRQFPWHWIAPLIGAVLVVGLCAASSSLSGLPLDDSWIHQDFARTLVTSGQFAFAPGRSGAGETSPLWVLLLTPPYLLAESHPPIWLIVAWVDLLGVVTLAALSLVAASGATLLAKSMGISERLQRLSALLAALATLSEWHLIWASTSGMETVLFCLLVVGVLILSTQGTHPAWIGVLVAVALGLRPEGWLLVLLVPGFHAWMARRDRRLRSWLRSWLVPFLLRFLPGCLLYLLLLLFTGGSIIPTTAFAKSAEFGESWSLLQIVTGWLPALVVYVFLSSPILVLLGCLALFRRPSRVRRPPLFWLLLIWSLFFLLAYAGRIGPGYHHSRYLLPALPPLIILAAVEAAPALRSSRRMLAQFAFLLLAICVPMCTVRAAAISQADVSGINCAEVATGQWMSAHLPAGAVIATHDVGAIGYFSGHSVIDITGLVDPELIPLLHDPQGLETYLKAQHVAYLAIYRDWFPPDSSLMQDLHGKVIYSACHTPYFQIYQTGW